jgi:hypothetical protein
MKRSYGISAIGDRKRDGSGRLAAHGGGDVAAPARAGRRPLQQDEAPDDDYVHNVFPKSVVLYQ